METQEKLIIKLGANMPIIDKVRYEKEGECLMLYLDQEENSLISQPLLRLFGRIASRASYHPQKKFFFSILKNEDFQKTNTGPSHLVEIFKKFSNVIPAKTQLVVYETAKKEPRGFIQAENKNIVDQFLKIGKISRLDEIKTESRETAFFQSRTGDLKETAIRLFSLLK
ncbi:MAG: hypothetical protein HYV52_02125 [Parcubacteria group bacterium]|nr:hypothetical protein [Parcubacteria group bacterium]